MNLVGTIFLAGAAVVASALGYLVGRHDSVAALEYILISIGLGYLALAPLSQCCVGSTPGAMVFAAMLLEIYRAKGRGWR